MLFYKTTLPKINFIILKNTLLLIGVTAILLLQSCGKSCEYLDDDAIEAPFKIERLEHSLFKIKDNQSMIAFLKAHQKFSIGYLGLTHVEDLPIVSEQLVQLFQNKHLVTFNEETQRKFGDFKSVEIELGLFFKHIKYHYPAFVAPEVNTVFTGFHFEKDLFVSDSLVVISLDYFLGNGAKFRPPYFNYFLDRYQPEYILPMIALGVSSKFNEVNMQDETMLSNMIFYGKAMYFTKTMLPCTADSLITMYSAQQMDDINKNAATIWAHFIENKLLFELNRHLIDKYVGESPKVNEIGEKCPGRIGRWLGWEIVKKYMADNPSITLPQLMAEKDAQKIFRVSKYKPKM